LPLEREHEGNITSAINRSSQTFSIGTHIQVRAPWGTKVTAEIIGFYSQGRWASFKPLEQRATGAAIAWWHAQLSQFQQHHPSFLISSYYSLVSLLNCVTIA
jgi:hypothetical protein